MRTAPATEKPLEPFQHPRNRSERLTGSERSGADVVGREQLLSADSVEKVGLPKLPDHSLVKTPFCTLLREIRVRKPLPKVKISISGAYFSDAQTMADFFNRIGQLRSPRSKCLHQQFGLEPPTEHASDTGQPAAQYLGNELVYERHAVISLKR